jgi:hypothetical protein
MAMHRERCLTCSGAVFVLRGVDHSKDVSSAPEKVQQNQRV